ncbi:MAG: carbohydrate kinase family protein [bacterium]
MRMNILVSGSVAYDRIMDFPDLFKNHILPDKAHILNVSFVVDKVKENFGGTAGNIAYNLALLGEKPFILSPVGEDFKKYRDWLNRKNVDLSYIKEVAGELTSMATMITDRSDNQISGFYPGSLDIEYCDIVKDIKDIKIAIIAPEFVERMKRYVEIYKEKNIPYIFDPGQQITVLTKDDINSALSGARVLIGNDYEIQLVLNKIGRTQAELKKMVKILVMTKGEKGSEIYSGGEKILIPAAKPSNVTDPTGAGDAYRAGFIKGLIENWSLEKTGKFASVVSSYAVEKYGTQNHEFTRGELEKRYFENYEEQLKNFKF